LDKKFLNFVTEDNLAHVVDIGDEELVFALGVEGNGGEGLFGLVLGHSFKESDHIL
jgi:hypothetical protein